MTPSFRSRDLFAAAACLVAPAAASLCLAAASWSDQAPHKSGHAEVNGIRLHYLDWGGDGPPVVMLHGIGDDPHIFDDLAARLKDRYRVVAYARRGHGASDAPEGSYDPATFVADLTGLMDRIGIRRASLVGWSMGGNEITDVAGRFPLRVDRIVYLDSGYDWSTPAFYKPFVDMVNVVAPGAQEVATLDAYRTWFRTAWYGKAPWSDGLEAYIRSIARPDGAGVLHPVPNEGVFMANLLAIEKWPRDYRKVKAPVLSLYAPVFFPEHGDAARVKKVREFEQKTMASFRRDSIARLKREVPGAIVKELPGRTHMSIGVEKPDELAAIVAGFLAGK